MLVTSVAALAVGLLRRPSRLQMLWERPRAIDEVQFSATVATELRAGRSLRQALYF